MDKIREACIWAAKKLDGGFDYKETHYQTVLGYALQKRGFVISSEENIEYAIIDSGHRIVIGYGRLDLKVITPAGDTWILELKCATNLKYLTQYRAQLRRYLKHSKYEVQGALIVFNNTTSVHIENILQDKCRAPGVLHFGLSSAPSVQQ